MKKESIFDKSRVGGILVTAMMILSALMVIETSISLFYKIAAVVFCTMIAMFSVVRWTRYNDDRKKALLAITLISIAFLLPTIGVIYGMSTGITLIDIVITELRWVISLPPLIVVILLWILYFSLYPKKKK